MSAEKPICHLCREPVAGKSHSECMFCEERFCGDCGDPTIFTCSTACADARDVRTALRGRTCRICGGTISSTVVYPAGKVCSLTCARVAGGMDP